MDTTNLATLYDLPALDWSDLAASLGRGFTQAPGTGGPNRHTSWLATVDVKGSPHVTAVGALWVDDGFWFQTGAGSRKGRNLARDPRCSLSISLQDYDLTVEGQAQHVTDPQTVARLVAAYVDQGWPARVDDSGTAITADFSAPSAGSPPWHLYRIVATSAVAVMAGEPGGASRWDF